MIKLDKCGALVTIEKGRRSRAARILSRAMLLAEDCVKVPLFGCQHCGECILSRTAYVCSQRCPKRMRNGPCGGTGEGGSCEVYPERTCVWFKIYRRARFFGRISLLYRVEKIHNWNLEKTSSWLNVFTKRIDAPTFFIRKKD